MEKKEYQKLIKASIASYNNPETSVRLQKLMDLIETYPTAWLAIDAGRLQKLMDYSNDANKIHMNLTASEKEDERNPKFKHYASFLSKYDSLLSKLVLSYKENNGAQQLESETAAKQKKTTKRK